MSLADWWDRLFWSIMVVIGAGLLWIRFIEPFGLQCVGPGLIVALLVGALFLNLSSREKLRQGREATEAARVMLNAPDSAGKQGGNHA